MAARPSGTSQPPPAPAAPKRPRARVVIFAARCKGCGLCVEFCPTDVLALSAEFNPKGYHFPVVVRAAACGGCELCGIYCPDFAIYSERLTAEKTAPEAEEGAEAG